MLNDNRNSVINESTSDNNNFNTNDDPNKSKSIVTGNNISMQNNTNNDPKTVNVQREQH